MSEPSRAKRFTIPLTPMGAREMTVYCSVLALVALLSAFIWWPFAIPPLILLGFVLSFFRDPERRIPEGQGAVVSPADGKVVEITEVDEPEFIGGRALRISIFLSVFNVHVNRSPCSGVVRQVRYRRGRFRNALAAESARENESNAITIERTGPQPVLLLVRQISGAIARRIVCTCATGDSLQTGERIGMIKFGSRTELYVPLSVRFAPVVRLGQRVRGGSTLLGRIE